MCIWDRRAIGYRHPAGGLASVDLMGGGIDATQSKFGARPETPVYIAEN